jgi:predicted nucleic acid-binding protein
LRRAETFDPVPVDDEVAHAWAGLRVAMAELGRRMPVNDSWIAATAVHLGLPVATQDDDYDDVPGLEVIRL